MGWGPAGAIHLTKVTFQCYRVERALLRVLNKSQRGSCTGAAALSPTMKI